MSTHLAHRGLALAAALLALAALLPAADALHGTLGGGAPQPDRVICGVVLNEADWPLAGVSLSIRGLTPNTVDHLIPVIHTAADGGFRVAIYTETYRFVFVDTSPPAERAGAAYLPAQLEVNGATARDPACGAPKGKQLPPIRLAAPHVGFIEATAIDAAVGGDARVGAATAQSVVLDAAVPGGIGWGRAPSNAAGVARVTCPLNAPTSLTFIKDGYLLAASAEFPCPARTALALPVYREPVPVDGAIGDAHTLEPLEGAAVAATLRTFAPLAGPTNPYVLADTTDEDGAYALQVPWGDTVDVAASAFGYGPQAGVLRPAIDDVASGLGLDLSLGRNVVAVGGRVVDLAGAGIPGALLGFTGPAPLPGVVLATSSADGAFAAALRVGDYAVTVQKAGRNANACDLAVGGDGAFAFAPSCLQLLGAGQGAVRGRVLDDLTSLPLGGIAAAAGPGAITGADGRFAFEVPAGPATLTLAGADFQTLTRSLTIALDDVLDLGDLRLPRTLVGLTIQARDDGASNVGTSGAPAAGAEVCLDLVGPGGATAQGCATAGAAGQVAFSVPWTKRGAALDAGAYRATASRLGAAPIYESQICIPSLQIQPGAAASAPCDLRAVDAVATPVGPVRDAHTVEALAGVAVAASAPDVPCDAPYSCQVTTGAAGTATLRLPAGRAYTVAASRAAYQAPADAAGVAPAQPVFADTRLARVAKDLAVTVVDVHTGAAVRDAPVDAAGGFPCDPGFGGFACAATTDGAGRAQLRVPWGALAVRFPGGDYDVVLKSGDEEGVAFEGAARGIVVADDGVAVVLDPPLRLLRQLGDPIQGKLLDFRGDPTTARVTPTLQRAGFTCDPEPASHDGPPLRFAGCHAQDASARYLLALPHGTSGEHLWTLDAGRADTFRETEADVPIGSTVDFRLWPLTFTLTVQPVNAATGAPIANAIICLRNLDQTVQALPTVSVEACRQSGDFGEAPVFEAVTWIRNDLDGEGEQFEPDSGDLFTVRGIQGFQVGALAAVLGPANAFLELPMGSPNPDTTDTDGDGFPDAVERLAGSDPQDPLSTPANDGLAYNDANDAHSVFLEAEGAEVLPTGQAAVAPAHGAFTFTFRAERYDAAGAASDVPAGVGTRVAFALLDASAAARLAGAGPGVPAALREAAFLVLEGTVGDGTFHSDDGVTVRVAIQADALPTAADVVVPWAFVEAGAARTNALGTFQPAAGYHSLVRNALRGNALADRLDLSFTPLVLGAASAACTPNLFDPDPGALALACDADSVEGSAAAVARVPVDLGVGATGASVRTTDGLPTQPLGDHVVGARVTTDPAASLASALDSDGDGTATVDELLAMRDPTQAGDDGDFPAGLAGALQTCLEARVAGLRAWLGV